MTTQYTAWLQSLAAANKGPVILWPATRKLVYNHVIALTGPDYSGAAFAGQVRSAPDSDAILAAFSIGTITYSGGKTFVPISLAAGTGSNSTGVLPADSDLDGIEYFPFDFLMTPSGGAAERLFGGLLPVSGHITLPA